MWIPICIGAWRSSASVMIADGRKLEDERKPVYCFREIGML